MKTMLLSFLTSYNNNYENLGIERIYTYIKNIGLFIDYEYIYVDEQLDVFEARIRDFDLIGISIYPDTIRYLPKFLRVARNANKIIFAGGKYSTDYPYEILNDYQDIDFIITGHGEKVIANMLSSLADGRSLRQVIDSSVYIVHRDKKEYDICNENIVDLAIPERSKYMLMYKNSFELFINDSHGCSGRCSFCTNCHNMRRYSTRSPQDIVNEMKNIYKRYGVRHFLLSGNSFEDLGRRGKEKINNFCNILLGEGIHFTVGCYIRPNFIREQSDVELLEKMITSGFTNVFIGVESGCQEDLILYNKPFRIETVNYNMSIISSYSDKLLLQYGFIMHNPYTTLDKMRRNQIFLREHRCCVIDNYISRLLVFKGTPIETLCRKDGLLTDSYSYQNPLGYIYQDTEVREIESFLINYIANCRNSLANINDIQRIYYTLKRSNETHEDYGYAVVISNIADTLIAYFDRLYIDNDIGYCMRNIDQLYNEINSQYKKLEIINKKLQRDSLRVATRAFRG